MFPNINSIGIRRKRLNLSQNQLAKKVGISQSMLTKIERGLVIPSYGKAVDIFNELDALEHTDDKIATDMMKKDVTCLKSSDTVEKAAKLAKKYAISQFPVVDGDRIIGSIRTSDLLELPKDMKIGWKINTPFPTVNENAPITTIRELLKHEQAVLVVRKSDIIGIVTAEDLL